uniref:Chromosome 11 open reading frame 52 n=1 Tax=Strix occidentalis caurina TaxID=311401 RepID=A0A8D0ETI9_STROC
MLGKICLPGSKGNNKVKTGSDFSKGLTKQLSPRDLTFQSSFSPKAPTYEDVPEFPVYATVSKPKSVKQDDSIHYADIQVFTKVRERSAAEVKNLQMQNATEYATLNFPRPRLKYDSKNGTLV